MGELTGIMNLLGEENAKRLKDGITDLLLQQVERDIEYDYDRFAYTKQIWCPLKELPKEKDWDEVPYETDCYSYLSGWNGCLNKILGE